MNVTLSRISPDLYQGTNEKGQSIQLGGNGNAVGPMESVLLAAAGCSTIDVVSILAKMRQNLVDIEVRVSSERREEIPRIFTKINLHYILTGNIKENKAKQAVESSLEKYCSVSRIIEATAVVTSSFEIRPIS